MLFEELLVDLDVIFLHDDYMVVKHALVFLFPLEPSILDWISIFVKSIVTFQLYKLVAV